MYKIQTLNKISFQGLELFPRENYEIASEIIHPDAILVRSAKMHDMELPDSVMAIARAGAGVNNIPIDACSQKGVVVFNTPGANANGVKELTIAALLMSSRKIIAGINWAKDLVGKGDEIPALVEKGKSQFAGPEIQGKTLGVIGLGAIGVSVANAAASLGMKVIGYDPYISVEAAWGLSSGVRRAVGLDTLLAEVDYITLHAPLNDKTRGLLNAEKFSMMKKGVRVINLARSGLVQNPDIIAALNDGIVSAYVTDFPDEDLLRTENVIGLPHLGASTPESEDNCARMAVQQVRDYLEFGTIKNGVNFPDSHLPPSGSTRLVVANKNIPNMVGQITSTLAQQNINIAELLNKHKGDYAYNIIDVDSDFSDADLSAIKAIDGVISARVISLQ